MLKRDITYKDFDGNEVTDTFYFHLSKTELMDLELSYQGGLEATINRIIETKDVKSLINEFKRIILAAYGVKSEDGKRFIKTDELREQFTQTAAYDALFFELATDAEVAAEFIKGIVPVDLSNLSVAEVETVQLPPVPPTS